MKSLLLSIITISISFFSIGQNCNPISSHCFNGVPDDVSSNNRGVVINGNPTFGTDRNGKPNSAMKFDGVDDALVLSDSLDYKLDSITFSCWVNVDNIGSSAASIMAVGGPTGDIHILLNNNPQFGFYGFSFGCHNQDQTAHRSIVGTLPNTNQWYHLAGVRTNTRVSLYVNGVLNGTTTFSASRANFGTKTEALIGRRHSNQQYFDGRIDDVRFYDCAKSATEINDIYKMYSCKKDTCYNTVTVYDTVLYYDTTKITVYDTVIVRDTIKVGVEGNPQTENNVFVFPIPADKEITVQLAEIGSIVTYKLLDTAGRAVKEGIVGAVSNFQVELPESRGSYVLQVFDGNKILFNSSVIRQ